MSDPSDPVTAAWARVRIQLNLQDVPAATTAAIEASTLTHWHRRFGGSQSIGNLAIFSTAMLPAGWMWCEPDRRRVVLARSVEEHYSLSPCLWDFAAVAKTMSGSGWRFYDVQNWAALERMRRQRPHRS